MNDRVAVYMLDVGQGDSTIVVLPDNRVVIFDCADDHVLRKILDNWGTPTIAAFVLSHLDQDHIAGALQFLTGYRGKIETLHVSADRDVTDDHEDAKRAKSLLSYAKDQGRDNVTRRRWELLPSTRDPRPLASGTDWSISLLAPPHGQQIEREREGEWEDANRYSSILRVQAGANAMLVGGDAPLRSWSELPAAELKADVFRIPHHGGALDDGGIPPGWDSGRLYRDVGAGTALISVGTNNAHGHPKVSWVEPITGGRTCRLLCTQVTSRCHAPLDVIGSNGEIVRDPVEIEALRKRIITQHNQWTEPQYRHLTDKRGQVERGRLEVPCAGTVLVRMFLTGQVEVLPSRGGEHERIVDDWEHPLCRPPAV